MNNQKKNEPQTEKKPVPYGKISLIATAVIVLIILYRLFSPAVIDKLFDSSTISKAEFDALDLGMSYDQCVEIIGGDGTVTANLSGVLGISGLECDCYYWKGTGGKNSHATLMFSQGSLASMTESNLR